MILAQGPLFKQRSTVAYRPTLRYNGDGEYVIANQFFPDFPSLDRSHFGSGSYIRKRLDLAMRKFAEYVIRQSDYVEAIEGEYP